MEILRRGRTAASQRKGASVIRCEHADLPTLGRRVECEADAVAVAGRPGYDTVEALCGQHLLARLMTITRVAEIASDRGSESVIAEATRDMQAARREIKALVEQSDYSQDEWGRLNDRIQQAHQRRCQLLAAL